MPLTLHHVTLTSSTELVLRLSRTSLSAKLGLGIVTVMRPLFERPRARTPFSPGSIAAVDRARVAHVASPVFKLGEAWVTIRPIVLRDGTVAGSGPVLQVARATGPV